MRSEWEKVAWNAVAYTRGRLRADNKGWDRFWGDFTLALQVKNNRAKMIAAGLYGKDTVQTLGERSTKAQVAGVGNCQEHADTAFVYLHDHGVGPIEMFNLRGESHAFDVIGRPASSSEADPATWGADTIVCDPWLEKVYPAADLRKYWPKGTPFARIRVDSPGLLIQKPGRRR